MHNNTPITIFVAAPGDMDPEREEVARAVARLNPRLGANMVVYDPDKLLYQCDEDFQSQISQEGVALVLTLLWYRVGTPLGEAFARADGSRPTGTQFEYENALALKQQTGKPDMLAYRKMADVPAKHADELIEFNRFWAEHFRNGDNFIGSFKQFMTTAEFAQLIEAEIETWYRKTYQQPYWLEDSPYRGLQAFEPRHASIFFGREDNIRALSTRLISKTDNNHFMLVLGASGSGKSSLIQAGLIPTLQAQGLILAICFVRQAN